MPWLSHVSYRHDGRNRPVGSPATVMVPGAFSSPWNTEVPFAATPSHSSPAGAAAVTCAASAMAPPVTSTAEVASATMNSLVRWRRIGPPLLAVTFVNLYARPTDRVNESFRETGGRARRLRAARRRDAQKTTIT